MAVLRLTAAIVVSVGLAAGALYLHTGWYGFNALIWRGPSWWSATSAIDPRLTPAMRLALGDATSVAVPGPFQWIEIAPGFAVAELPVLSAAEEVDRLYLARVDPVRYRIVVRSQPAATRDAADWMTQLGALLVINGSFYSRTGEAATPVVSGSAWLGPQNYPARHGAFISSPTYTGLRDLAGEDWRVLFAAAEDALVSYPLLVAPDGSSRAGGDPRWLASRSFVGEDMAGRIVFGTTRDGFFSLARFATFLRGSGLGLTKALNLDGGPLACQAIAAGGFRRDVCGQWELTTNDDGELRLLRWTHGHWPLPLVMAVLPR